MLGGYSHKLTKLLEIVLTGITSPDMSPDKVSSTTVMSHRNATARQHK